MPSTSMTLKLFDSMPSLLQGHDSINTLSRFSLER